MLTKLLECISKILEFLLNRQKNQDISNSEKNEAIVEAYDDVKEAVDKASDGNLDDIRKIISKKK